MKQTMKLFQIGLRQIAKDGMLLMLLPVPFLAGAAFKFAVPYLSGILEEKFSFSLLPWYGLADGLLICLTPTLVAMVCAFLLLDERDEGVCAFYQITPMGGTCYLVARIGLPMIWAFAATMIGAPLFQISSLPFDVMIAGAFLSTLTGVVLAMLVVSFAQNRVEGLALSKLLGISFLGLFLVWFVPAPYAYLCSFLPSFWIGKLIMDGVTPLVLLPGFFVCALWMLLFARRFFARIGSL